MLTRRTSVLTRSRVLTPQARSFTYNRPAEETVLPSDTPEAQIPKFNHPLQSVAVLGSGISGLTAAWYLHKFAPGLPITVYEKSAHLGGWFKTKHVKYGKGKEVAFEQGPRTLRPWTLSALPVFDMIRQLDIADQLTIVKKDSPAAKNRYVYYNGKLNELPSSLKTAFTTLRQPALKGAVPGMMLELFRKRRDMELTDETVGSFMSRRLNKHLANNLVSAMLHGVYAGDMDQLSMRSVFPVQWRHEGLFGSITRGMVSGKKIQVYEDIMLREELYWPNHMTLMKVKDASVYSFKGGIETLSKAIIKELEAAENVIIKTETPVESIVYGPAEGETEPFMINENDHHSHIISTLPAHALAPLLPLPLPALSQIKSVTVLVVNLYFTNPTLLPVRGFGYLLPKSLPLSENPHRALGVIFDSESMPDPANPGTKLTVMLGGHWYGANPPTSAPENALEMARDVLRTQLGITDEPAASNVVLQKECIPQYTLGHEERLVEIHEGLMDAYEGRLGVAGSSYRGVGVNDCVRFSREVAKGLAENTGCSTGLEHVLPAICEAVTVSGVWKRA